MGADDPTSRVIFLAGGDLLAPDPDTRLLEGLVSDSNKPEPTRAPTVEEFDAYYHEIHQLPSPDPDPLLVDGRRAAFLRGIGVQDDQIADTFSWIRALEDSILASALHATLNAPQSFLASMHGQLMHHLTRCLTDHKTYTSVTAATEPGSKDSINDALAQAPFTAPVFEHMLSVATSLVAVNRCRLQAAEIADLKLQIADLQAKVDGTDLDKAIDLG